MPVLAIKLSTNVKNMILLNYKVRSEEYLFKANACNSVLLFAYLGVHVPNHSTGVNVVALFGH
jgi:hypothetical protein